MTVPTPARVFVACAGAGQVEEYALADGSLGRVGRAAPVADVRALAVDHDRGLLYAVRNAGDPACLTLDVSVPGEPRLLHQRTLPATTTYVSLAGDRLLSASYLDSCLVVIDLDATGLPTGVAHVTRPGRQVHCALPTPDGRHVYAACLSDDTIMSTPSDGAADWTRQWTAPEVRGPRHLRFDASGEHLYAVDELTAQLEIFDVDRSSGALHHAATIDTHGASALRRGVPRNVGGPPAGDGMVWAAELVLTPDGRFALVSERSASTVSVIKLSSRSLVATHRAERRPRAMSIYGPHLLTAGELSGRLRVETVHDDGDLVTTHALGVGSGPIWITAAPG